MAVAQRFDAETYERLVADGLLKRTELWDGVPVEKPPVSVGHARLIDRLSRVLNLALDPAAFVVSAGGSRLRVGERSYAIPDLVVLPAEVEARMFADHPTGAAVYDEPLPLVVEVWSPSTGGHDLHAKLPRYRAQGHAEIWRLHQVERSLQRWIRQPNGAYREEQVAGGMVRLAALAGVAVDLDALFSAP